MIQILTPTNRIHVNGVSLYVRMVGVGDPLVMLHGFTGNSRSWSPHIHALKQHAAILAIDLLGHGGSDVPLNPERYRMEKTIADLISVFDILGIERVNLMGYSMGGRVALALALHHPHRIKSLILESSTPGIISHEERHARIRADEALAELIEQQGLEEFINQWEKIPLFATQSVLPADVREQLRSLRMQNTPRGLINSLRGLGTGTQPAYWSRLSDLASPTLLITGEHDQKYTEIAHQMATLSSHIKVEVVSGAGHTVHLEKAAEFDQLVLNFIKG